MLNPTNPPITRRLFHCPSQERFFWVPYDQDAQCYTYAGEVVMTLEQIKTELNSYLIPERRFWDGPNSQHVMLPFNKARGRAFYGDAWRPLDVLRALGVKEAPSVWHLPPATAEFAPGASPKGAFTSTRYARSRGKS